MENWFIILLVFQGALYATMVESMAVPLSTHDSKFVESTVMGLDSVDNKPQVLLDVMNRLFHKLYNMAVPSDDASRTKVPNTSAANPENMVDDTRRPSEEADIPEQPVLSVHHDEVTDGNGDESQMKRVGVDHSHEVKKTNGADESRKSTAATTPQAGKSRAKPAPAPMPLQTVFVPVTLTGGPVGTSGLRGQIFK